MSILDHCHTIGVGCSLTFPSYLQLEAALFEQGTDGLSVCQFLRTCDVLEVGVGIVALQFSHLAVLTVAEEDELQSVETQNGGILQHFIVHAVIEIVEQQTTVQWPRVDGGVNVKVRSGTHQESF